MPLSYKVDDIEDVDENLRALYVEGDDGSHVLDVEGVKPPEEFDTVYKSLQEERKLHKATKSALSGYGELKPEELNAIKDELEELRAKATEGGTDEEKLEKLLQVRQQPLVRERDTLATELEAARNREVELSTKLLNRDREKTIHELADGVIQAGFIRDVMLRARMDLKYDTDREGFYDEAGATAEEWFNYQLNETPGWAMPSNGAGAKGGKGGKNNVNPFDPKSDNYSLTAQTEMMQSDPKRAEKLKALANVGR